MLCGLVSTRRSLRELRLTENNRRGEGTRGSNRNIAAEIKQVSLDNTCEAVSHNALLEFPGKLSQ